MNSASPLTILYGSQTGNAEDMAKRIGLKAKTLGLDVIVQTMDDFQLKELPKQRMVLFICSTTGHGQEPENMKNLFTFMRRRDLPKDCLSKLKFAVYGLGDSSYAKFNYVSKIVHKRLKECGAQPVQDLVASDEQHRYGCDGLIYPRLSELWPKLTECDKELVPSPAAKLRSYCVTYMTSSAGEQIGSIFKPAFVERYKLKEAICIRNERVTEESHFQDTRFLCFKAREDIDYEPGDVCTIYPENSPDNVSLFIKLLNLDPKRKIKLQKLDPNYMVNYLYDFIPDGMTIEDVVRYYLDIQSVPKRSFFEHLWPFSDDELERSKLREFSTTEGQEEVYDYCIRPKRSILETLMDFPNTTKNIELDSLFDMVPPIKPRSFSIASASQVHPNEIQLIVGVVNYKTIMKKPRKGLCSNYLASMIPVMSSEAESKSSVLRFFIRGTSFKLPLSAETPIIMIGPGLGIAPFRGFIEHRHRLLTSSGELSKLDGPSSLMYYGCRYEKKDFYFRDELKKYSEDSVIRLQVAFSRDQPKRHVQDLLRLDADLIANHILSNNANLYVAGNSKLPEDIRVILADILSRSTNESGEPADGEKIVISLEAANRIQYDCW